MTKTFTVGEDQTFTVPASIVGLHVKAVGAQGERAQAPCCGTEGYGGRGARVTGNLSVTPGHTLYVEVEVGGGSGSKNGGWGGGDSDVRTAPLSAGLSPDDRLIVAGGGGGGGGGGGREAYGGGGGNAGEPGGPGVQPPDPNNPESKEGSNEGGGAGTGTKGGAGGSGCEDFEFSLEGKAGSLGHGGSGGEGLSGGGGGGAGYYGGGGGGGACAFSDLTVVGGGGGGGGGSSLVPAGGELFLAAESEAPQVQISYTTPKVTTDAASSVTPTYATLNATVNPEGVNVTDCHFEYGTSMSYGANVPCSPLPGSGTSPVAVSAVASGLSPSTTYHFRAVATNRFATTVGADHTVTTAALPTPASAAAVRCVAKPGTGKYVDDNCLAHAHVKPEEKQFELENGLTKPGLTASAGPSVLETESGTRIECTGSSATGKWDVDLNSKGQPTPVKEAESIFATFTGCTLGKAKGNCQTAGASTGEIRTGELQGTLGFLSKSGHKAGFELAPTVKKGKFAEFNCEGFGMILLGEGTGKLGDCAIAEIVGPVNLMTTTSSELYTGIKGPEGEEQTPQHFEGKTTHCNVESKIGAGGWERNVFRFEWTVGYEEALEIRA